MPRRRALTGAQLAGLLALPATEAELARHWVLGDADLAAVGRRRRDHNRLGFALQLCALRYPGRPLRPGEAVPELALRFVADGVGAAPEAVAAYGTRPQTRSAHLDELREAFGFAELTPACRRELAAWLLPVGLATTSAVAVAAALLEETRRRGLIVPGSSVVEDLTAAALTAAERHVARQITGRITPSQADALDALLAAEPGTGTSVLAWARQPPGAPGHRALARLVAALDRLRAIGLDPACTEGVHPERLRRLAREGGRFTAQHLRALSPLRRRATLAATVLDTTTRLTDDGVGTFDRAVGRMFRRAEIGEQDALLRNARAVNDKVCLLARLGAALIEARDAKGDLDAAVADAVGWDRLARGVAEAERLARPDRADLPALAVRAWPVLRRLGPTFLGAFRLRAVPAAAATLRAVEALREVYASGGRRWPGSLPTSFLRLAWRDAVHDTGGDARRVPNLAERRLYAFGAASTWPPLQPFIAGTVDTQLIATHWDEVLRLAASVRTGRVSASLMLKRLGAYPRQNSLALALREIGRIERTLFTLDWLERPELRRQATAELNKGEARNALARAVCFHRLGRLRDRTAELQQHRASGLALVTAAIALWNTVYLGRAVDALHRRGEAVPDALLAHLAPLGWQHVNLTGDYLWGQGAELGVDGFRPLRGERHALADAA